MTGQLERELERMLAGAAEGAPQPGPGLAAAVRVRRRRRRQRRAVVLGSVVVAVATVATGATVALRPDPAPAPAGRPQWSGAVPDFAAAGPIGEVWPDAVRSLPATLPDGRGYSVSALLGGDRYLVLPKEVGDRPVAKLSVYDVGAGTVTPLPGVPDVPTTNPIPPDPGPDRIDPARETIVLGVAAGRVVWAIETGSENRPAQVEVWSARLDGDAEPARLARVDAPGGVAMTGGTLRDDAAFLTVTSYSFDGRAWKPTTAVHRIPLDGGEARLLRDADGWRPSPGNPAWLLSSGDDVKVGMPLRGELWNVTTGLRIHWRAATGVTRLHFCDPMMCLGQTADSTWVAQRPDGTAFPWPQPSGDGAAVSGYRSMNSTMDGRFGLTGRVLWDRIGGGAALVPLTGGETIFGTDHGVYSHQGDDDDPKTVVDLRAIG
jgi:hypothetical protein